MEARDQEYEPAATIQESVGASHSPQTSVRAHQVNVGPQVEVAPRERRYDRLRKDGGYSLLVYN